MSKFNEAVKDALDAMKDAEIELAYYIVDPDKNHPSAIDSKIYVDRSKAEKEAKKLGLDFDAWPGLFRGGVTKYNIPKKYKLVK